MRPLIRSLAMVAAAVAALLGWRACLPADPLADLAPGIDPPVRRALAAGDLDRATTLAAAHGHWSSVRIRAGLRDGLVVTAGDRDPRRRDLVLAGLDAWSEAIARSFELPEYRRDAAFWRNLAPSEAAALARRWGEVDQLLTASDLPPDTVKARLLVHEGAFRAVGDHLGAARTGYDLANICLKLGQIDEARSRFGEVLADGRRWRLTAATCDALNSLALFALVADDSAGTEYLSEALTLARRSRLAARAGRALTVAAMHERREGRFARSMDLLEEAIVACRELGQPWQALPYLLYLMRFHAGLDDWRQVAELMPRAQTLQREAIGAEADPLMLRREGVRLRELELRLAIHQGRVEQALTDYPDLIAAARAQPFAETSYIHDRLVRALLAVHRPDAALTVLPDALAHAEAHQQPMRRDLLLAQAEACLDVGRLAGMAEALARFEAAGADQPRWRDGLAGDAHALRALLAHRRGSGDAKDELTAGLKLMADDVAESDGSSLAYLELQRRALLRRALTEIAGTDAPTAYGLELLWRRLPSQLGRGSGLDRMVAAPGALARELAARRLGAVGPDRQHLLYREVSGAVVRWHASGAGLACDTLAVTAASMHRRIDDLLAELARDPGDPAAPVPPALAAMAETLASDLLPAWPAGPPRQLLISAEGALTQLPFAVLDLDAGSGYTPLAARVDVGTVRDCGPRADAEAAGPGLMVADPEVDPRLRRRHPGLTDLAGSAHEARRVQATVPGLTVLTGPDATLPRLVAAWDEADLLYFACHTVRSSASPFRTFLPLSPPPGPAPLAPPSLDIAAIRCGDLHATRLVVLASCASGAPYVSGRAWAPSLGDAFLDAGAGAVLHTLWRVRDDEAARLPSLLLTAWAERGLDPVAALGEARRAVMADADGTLRHPFGWAAYTLSLRDF